MNINSRSMLPGASLASKIKVLAALGSLGERVLIEPAATKIDNDKEYPSHLRARFFEFNKRLGETKSHLRLSSTSYK